MVERRTGEESECNGGEGSKSRSRTFNRSESGRWGREVTGGSDVIVGETVGCWNMLDWSRELV